LDEKSIYFNAVAQRGVFEGSKSRSMDEIPGRASSFEFLHEIGGGGGQQTTTIKSKDRKWRLKHDE
jgi:hypothetical protein